MKFTDFKKGDKITILERTPDYGILEHDGEVLEVNETNIETVHARDKNKYPQYSKLLRAYEKTWTTHYGLKNIK